MIHSYRLFYVKREATERERKTEETKIFLRVCKQRKNARSRSILFRRGVPMYIKDIVLKASPKDQEKKSELIDCY